MQLQKVNFEQAKILKALGFDSEVNDYFLEHLNQGIIEEEVLEASDYNKSYSFHTSRPTVALAIKWLRKVHQINIHLRYTATENKWRSYCSSMTGLWDEFAQGSWDTDDIAESNGLTQILKKIKAKI